ncbi:alcohol dehydrogenase catalytic domain-containing protein [Leucobacter chromiiresistens]
MVFTGAGRPHEALRVDPVALAAGEALVRVELATICGSDVHTALGHRAEPVPLVLGHEAVGRIERVGSGARAIDGSPLAAGDRVVWSLTVPCGACDRCRRGVTQKCHRLRKYGHERIGAELPAGRWDLSGGFATHVHLLDGTAVARVPDDLPAAVLAPAGCGIATARAALRSAARTVPFARRGGATRTAVLVTGAGLIGLAVTAMASEQGAAVTVSDPDASRRELALRFGADRVHDPRGSEAPDPFAAGASAPLGAGAFDIVIDASGSASAVASGLDAVAIGGAVVWVGSVFPTAPVPVVPERVVRGLVTISGVHNYAGDDLAEAVDFLSRHGRTYPFDELVGAVYALERIDAALERAAEQREARVGVAAGPPPGNRRTPTRRR